MAERELSPYSARVALTQKLRQGVEADSQPRAQNAHSSSPVVRRNRWDVPAIDRGGESTRGRLTPPRHLRDKSEDAVAEFGSSARDNKPSPEPYRKPRDPPVRSRDRHRTRDRGISRERRSKYRSRSRDRDISRERSSKYRSRSRDRDISRERSSKYRSRSRDRPSEKRRERSSERKHHGLQEIKPSRDRDHRLKHHRRGRSRSGDRYRHNHFGRHHSPDSRSRSPSPYRHKRRSPSFSPPPKRRRKQTPSRSSSPMPFRHPAKPLPEHEVSFRGVDNSDLPPTKYGGAPPNIEKPNFKPTGLLAKAANKVEGTNISLKYHEPPEARKPPPSEDWRIVVFNGDDVVDTVRLGTKSCWLVGRTARAVDYLLEHPSCSGQHAVIQFRYVETTVEDDYGVKKVRGRVKPYIMDLESENKTELNDKDIEDRRYIELKNNDVLRFGACEREYVVQLPPPDKPKS